MILFSGNRGFTILEVVAGISVLAISLFSLISVFNLSFSLVENSVKNIQASLLLEEGWESLRFLRDSGWTENVGSLQNDTKYSLFFADGKWSATTSIIAVDGIFERTFVLQGVYRDFNDDIVSSGGVLDPGTKKAVVSVSWLSRGSTTTETIMGYLVNLFDD